MRHHSVVCAAVSRLVLFRRSQEMVRLRLIRYDGDWHIWTPLVNPLSMVKNSSYRPHKSRRVKHFTDIINEPYWLCSANYKQKAFTLSMMQKWKSQAAAALLLNSAPSFDDLQHFIKQWYLCLFCRWPQAQEVPPAEVWLIIQRESQRQR